MYPTVKTIPWRPAAFFAAAVWLAVMAAALAHYKSEAAENAQAAADAEAKAEKLQADYSEAVKRAEIADSLNKALLQQLENERVRADTARAELNQAIGRHQQWAAEELPPEIRKALKK